ncbi:MAG: SpoIIE family protein phosphatase [Bacteroidia bacterium]|nr:SpoIIE family protein phosphatase [Bacteroidia bacterium]
MDKNNTTQQKSNTKYISESFRKTLLAKVFAITGILLTLPFGIDALFRKEYNFGIFLLILFVIITILNIHLWVTKKYQLGNTLIVACMFLANIYLITILARTDTTAPLWHFVSPPLFLFATNRKTGTYLIIALIIITVLSFELIPELKEIYTTFYKIRFYSILGTVILLSYIYEFVREKSYIAFIEADKQKTIYLQQVMEQNEEIQQKNEEIEAQSEIQKQMNEELLVQKEELQTQSELLQTVNKSLERSNTLITDSIKYAKNIQEAILPDIKIIKKYFPESFIIYLPRDIVSGDFYWFSVQNEMQFIAAVDCTGHGVPGAFMSMIGHTLLNETVNVKNILSPKEILDELSRGISGTLTQKGKTGLKDDGMDISLCRFDLKHKELLIAMAGHYAYFSDESQGTETCIQTIKGDSVSIGETQKKGDFKYSEHKINYTGHIRIFMLTDGFTDQFGGEYDQKFMAIRLNRMLNENKNSDMDELNNLLISTFENWKSGYSQIDDVLLIGIRV